MRNKLKFIANECVLIQAVQNGQDVGNISSILKTYSISFSETTQSYPTLLLKILWDLLTIIT